MRRRILTSILLGFLLLVLTLPLLNMLSGIVESGKLMGGVTIAGNTDFSLKGWWDGSYQAQKEKYVNDNIGFRPDLVRLTHQLDYEAFGKLHQDDVVLGLDHYLHSGGYIRALYGTDFLGRDTIRDMMRKLRFISDTLGRAGKPLIFAFIPSKARIYPETIPPKHRKPSTHENNYEVMLAECRRQGIRTFDVNGWYMKMRPESKQPLFTRQGIHWTRWSADHVADSLNHIFEQLLHIDIPDMKFEEMRCGPAPEDGEDDIALALNLIWPFTTDTFCYNSIGWNADTATKQKPKVIFIADSFFWTWVHDGLPGWTYDGWEFWYYFNELWTQESIAGHAEHTYVDKVDWMGHIQQSDALVIFFTEANLSGAFIRNFINQAYAKYGGR